DGGQAPARRKIRHELGRIRPACGGQAEADKRWRWLNKNPSAGRGAK
ncbi:unnamed protein product, partial [marine sediment metagenome]